MPPLCRNALSLLKEMVLLDPLFDHGLVYLLRIMIANFIKSEKKETFNGLPMSLVLDRDRKPPPHIGYDGCDQYADENVLQMG